MRTNSMRFFGPAAVLFLFCALAFIGCNQADTAASSAPAAVTSGAKLFSVQPEQLQHIQIVAVQPNTLNRVLRMTGSVAYDGFKTTPVISQLSGPVVKILVSPGQHVKAGEPLLYASSPEYAQLRNAFLKAQDAAIVADKNFTRAKDLYEHHAIAEIDLLTAESTRNQTQADLQSATQGLKILGVSKPDAVTMFGAVPEFPVVAPIAGEVVDRLVAPGQLIQAGATQCFTISDLSTVWVLVNVYEHDVAFVHDGDEVDIKTESYPEVFHGKISYVNTAMDPNARTLQARIVTNNPGGKLKRDMYVTAMVKAGKTEKVLTVPDSAVLRDTENEPYVFVVMDKNQFARRQVVLGASVNNQTEIKTGLKQGEQVVGQGALFLQFANSLQ